ncbi:MAG: 16S rRNA (adenine(1518)-N(6)/adenine(1519)-N(6))-dimethyltransferase RsmA [Acidimicrobiales bacterium]
MAGPAPRSDAAAERLRWTDDHCHLHFDDAGAEAVADAVAAAQLVGVERMVTVGCDVADSGAAIVAARRHPGVYATAGVHPHEAAAGVAGLVDLLTDPEVVAVGECGLDYHYEHSPRSDQKEVFAHQIALAHEHGMALVIHSREAWDDTFAVLRAAGVPERTVFHCFSGGPDEARRCLDLGAYLSFSGIITFKSADELRAAAVLCPVDRLLIETDSPYLALVPCRVAQPAGVGAGGRRRRCGCSWSGRRAHRRGHLGQRLDALRAARPGVTLTRRQLTEVLDRHGLAPSRALGQHFVVDPNTVRRVARLARVGPGDHVLEIGAGTGSLTLALVETGASVTAVEIDRGLLAVLQELVAPGRARIVPGDALALDWATVLAPSERWVLVANLPYNVATPLILDLLDGVPVIERMLVMVQREVGERLAAGVGDAAYGIPSVKVAYWATARVIGRVGADVFLPRPKVESALVEIVRRPVPTPVGDPERLFRLVRMGFGQRRKMLRRALADQVAPDAFVAAGIRPEARAEELTVEDWGRLAAAEPEAPNR